MHDACIDGFSELHNKKSYYHNKNRSLALKLNKCQFNRLINEKLYPIIIFGQHVAEQPGGFVTSQVEVLFYFRWPDPFTNTIISEHLPSIFL